MQSFQAPGKYIRSGARKIHSLSLRERARERGYKSGFVYLSPLPNPLPEGVKLVLRKSN
jgi:hypothetical protein